jgi:hypothetical protein
MKKNSSVKQRNMIQLIVTLGIVLFFLMPSSAVANVLVEDASQNVTPLIDEKTVGVIERNALDDSTKDTTDSSSDLLRTEMPQLQDNTGSEELENRELEHGSLDETGWISIQGNNHVYPTTITLYMVGDSEPFGCLDFSCQGQYTLEADREVSVGSHSFYITWICPIHGIHTNPEVEHEVASGTNFPFISEEGYFDVTPCSSSGTYLCIQGTNNDDDDHDVELYVDTISDQTRLTTVEATAGQSYCSLYVVPPLGEHTYYYRWYCNEHNQYHSEDFTLDPEPGTDTSYYFCNIFSCRDGIYLWGTNWDTQAHTIHLKIDETLMPGVSFQVASGHSYRYPDPSIIPSIPLTSGQTYDVRIEWDPWGPNDYVETTNVYVGTDQIVGVFLGVPQSSTGTGIFFSGVNYDDTAKNVEIWDIIGNLNTLLTTINNVPPNGGYQFTYPTTAGQHSVYIKWQCDNHNPPIYEYEPASAPVNPLSVPVSENQMMSVTLNVRRCTGGSGGMGTIRFSVTNNDNSPKDVSMYINNVLQNEIIHVNAGDTQSHDCQAQVGGRSVYISWQCPEHQNALETTNPLQITVTENQITTVPLAVPRCLGTIGHVRFNIQNNDDETRNVEMYIDNTQVGSQATILGNGNTYTSSSFEVTGSLQPSIYIRWQCSYHQDAWHRIDVPNVQVSNGQTTDISVVIPAIKDWTFICYLDGDNDLSDEIQRTFNELGSANVNNNVNVIILKDRQNFGDSHLYYVEQGASSPTQLITPNWFPANNEVNMGDGMTLQNFVQWSLAQYPAEYTMLYLTDHGFAWQGCCFDWGSNNDRLTISEIDSALSAALPSGQKIDVLYFEDCYMANFETCYQLKPYVNYLVGPEITEGRFPDITSVIQNMDARVVFRPRNLASDMVSSVIGGQTLNSVAMSAIDLSRIDSLKIKVNNFATDLIQKFQSLPAYRLGILRARLATESYQQDEILIIPRHDLVDLSHFAELINNDNTLPLLHEKAQDVINSLVSGGGESAIVNEYHQTGTLLNQDIVDHAHGLNIYFPENQTLSEYRTLDFAEDTQWDEFHTVLCIDGYESDNNFDQAKVITTDGTAQYHNFDAPDDDLDYVQFSVDPSPTYAIEANGHINGLIPPVDVELDLYKPNHGHITGASNSLQWICSDGPGIYYLRIHNTNQIRGIRSYYSIRITTIPDTIPPETQIKKGPNGEHPLTDNNDVKFKWEGSDLNHPANTLRYDILLEGPGYTGEWQRVSGETLTITYNNLRNGDYTFQVRTIDLAGNIDLTPETRSFVIQMPPPVRSPRSGGTDEFYWTIQDAINAAAPNTIIYVSEYYSPYVGDLSIEEFANANLHHITLQAVENQNPIIIDGSITIYSHDITISGFTITGGNEEEFGNRYGIDIEGDYNIIRDNNIANENGLNVGIKIYNNGNHNSLLRNNIRDILQGGTGIQLEQGSNTNLIDSNFIIGSQQGWNTGISLTNSDQNIITNNVIKGNDELTCSYGIYMLGESDHNTITNNVLKDFSQKSIWLDGTTFRNTLYHNNFLGANSLPHDARSTGANSNNWNNPDTHEGNHYDWFIAPDSNSDGIVDSEYLSIGRWAVDWYPLVNTYDDIPPEFGNNLTPTKAFIGKPFTFQIEVRDNLCIQNVDVIWQTTGRREERCTMTPTGTPNAYLYTTYTYSITVPLEAQLLSYYFEAQDAPSRHPQNIQQTQWNTLTVRGVQIITPNNGEIYCHGDILTIQWYSAVTNGVALYILGGDLRAEGTMAWIADNDSHLGINSYSIPITNEFLRIHGLTQGSSQCIIVLGDSPEDPDDQSIDSSDHFFAVYGISPVTEANLNGNLLTFTATDEFFGVARTMYQIYTFADVITSGHGHNPPSLDEPGVWVEGPEQLYTSPISFSPGIYRVFYYSVDTLGNKERTKEIDFTTHVQILSPNGAQRWYQDGTYTIQWNSLETTDWAQVEISPSGGTGWIQISSVLNHQGLNTFSWFIDPEVFPLSSHYRVRVVTISQQRACFDTSDADFSVAINPIIITRPHTNEPMVLSIRTPNGGEVISPGSTLALIWTCTGKNIPNTVDILISSDYGMTWSKVGSMSNKAGENSYKLTIPKGQKPTDQFLIKIVSIVNKNNYVVSNPIIIK